MADLVAWAGENLVRISVLSGFRTFTAVWISDTRCLSLFDFKSVVTN